MKSTLVFSTQIITGMWNDFNWRMTGFTTLCFIVDASKVTLIIAGLSFLINFLKALPIILKNFLLTLEIWKKWKRGEPLEDKNKPDLEQLEKDMSYE